MGIVFDTHQMMRCPSRYMGIENDTRVVSRDEVSYFSVLSCISLVVMPLYGFSPLFTSL